MTSTPAEPCQTIGRSCWTHCGTKIPDLAQKAARARPDLRQTVRARTNTQASRQGKHSRQASLPSQRIGPRWHRSSLALGSDLRELRACDDTGRPTTVLGRSSMNGYPFDRLQHLQPSMSFRPADLSLCTVASETVLPIGRDVLPFIPRRGTPVVEAVPMTGEDHPAGLGSRRSIIESRHSVETEADESTVVPAGAVALSWGEGSRQATHFWRRDLDNSPGGDRQRDA